MSSQPYRLAPTVYRPVGFELAAPDAVELTPGDASLRCRERQGDRPVGELEISTFSAALIIDRDGILEDKVKSVAGPGSLTLPVELPGASGYRAEVHGARSALPYLFVFAFAPLGVDGGVVITVRSAGPDWPAADAILQSLRLLTRHRTANDGGSILPFAGG